MWSEREQREKWLKAYSEPEYKEAVKRLEDYRPLLVDRMQTVHYRLTDDVGKKMTLGEFLSDLIRPQYEKNKQSVQAYWKRHYVMRAFFYLAALCAILFFYVQSISLPPTGGPMTFEPLFAKLSITGFFAFLLAAFATGYCRDRHWIPNEQDVATDFYEAHSFYEGFIKDEKDMSSLNKARKLVRKAVAMLELAKGRVSWAALAPLREKIWKIGQDVNNRLLPAMQDHKRSTDMGDHLASLACCFLQSDSESIEIALEELQNVVQDKTKGVVSPSIAARLSTVVRGHRNAFAWTVAPASIAIIAAWIYFAVEPFRLNLANIMLLVTGTSGLGLAIMQSLKGKEP
jgi:hypothetical protein